MSNAFKEWFEENKRMEEAAKAKGMCIYCDPDSDRNQIWQDGLTGDWYLELQTSEWDSYNDDYVTIREYINYCPYCGRELE